MVISNGRRNYAAGFLRNTAGDAYATVSNLIPNKEYYFKVYQYAITHHVGGENGLKINGLPILMIGVYDRDISQYTALRYTRLYPK